MRRSKIKLVASFLLIGLITGTLYAQRSGTNTRSSETEGSKTVADMADEPVPADFTFDWEASESGAEAASEGPRPSTVNVREAVAGPDLEDEATDEEAAAAATQTVRVSLFKIRNWPEFKVENRQQCRRILGRRVCVNLPQAFQRNCELVAFAEIKHPTANSIRPKIERCCRQAVGAGVLASVLSGNLGAGATALKTYLTACLAATGTEQLNRLSVRVRTESTCGQWRPR